MEMRENDGTPGEQEISANKKLDDEKGEADGGLLRRMCARECEEEKRIYAGPRY